jgi:transcriptional regulator with XRE-family HTH domain
MISRIGPKKPFKHYLFKWRKAKHLTQEQLAERIGTYKGQISNWESGARDLTPNVQLALAEALDIEPMDLYRDPDQPSPDELLRDSQIRELALLLKEEDTATKEQALDVVKILIGKRA